MVACVADQTPETERGTAMCLPVREDVAAVKEWECDGLKCAVVQGDPGCHWCGYVRIPPGHPLHAIADFEKLPVHVYHQVNFSHLEECVHEDGQGRWIGFACCGSLSDMMFDPDDPPKWITTLPDSCRQVMIDADWGTFFPGQQRHFWRQPEVMAETEELAKLVLLLA